MFRKLFGSDENKNLLISLINSIVEPDLHVDNVTITNPFILAAYERDKETILDIKAVGSDGKLYDIEMQLAPHSLYGAWAVYYVTKMFAEQLGAGMDYSALHPAIGIHFLDFRYFDDDEFVRQFALRNVKTGEAHDGPEYLRLYYVEMPKFVKDWPDIRTALDRWVAFLNKARDLSSASLPVQMREPIIVQAIEKLERIGMDPAERAIYEAEVKASMVDAIQLRDAQEEGMRQVLVRLMGRRIGQPPITVQRRLKDLSVDKLNELSDALDDLRSYDEVEAWLTRH